jgi:putative tricarboxylic transport membrane protein
MVFSLIVCLESWRLEVGNLHAPGPGFLPFLTGLLLGGLSGIAFIQALKEKPSQEKGFLSFGAYLIKVGLLAVALVVYVLLLSTLGFLVGTFLLLLFLFRIMEPLGWKTVFLASIITLAAVYLLFDVFLGTRLPIGILGIG